MIEYRLVLKVQQFIAINKLMNINNRTHKSNLQFLRHEKIIPKASSNLINVHHYEKFLAEAKHCYHQQKDFARAVKGFEQYLKAIPYNDEAWYLCGVCLMQLQQFESAIAKFERVSDLYSLKHNALLLASMAFNKRGNIPKSYELANQCIRRSPLFEEALCFRAKLHIQMNQFISAQSDFKNAVKINPKSYLGLAGLGDCHRHFNKYGEAVDCYTKCLGVQSKQHASKEIMDCQINLKLAICYYFLQRDKQCGEIMKSLSLEEKMKRSQLYYYYGLCQLRSGARDKGASYLQYSIRLDTNPFIIQKAFKKLVLLYLENYQFYEAQSLIQMSRLYRIQATQWQALIELCMLTIKGHYHQALRRIKDIQVLLKEHKPTPSELKFNTTQKQIDKIAVPRNRFVSLFKKKASMQGSSRFQKTPKSKQQLPLLLKIKRSIDRIESLRMNKNKYPGQSLPLKMGRVKTQYVQAQQKPALPFTQKEKQVIYPIVLQFKAYCQFFNQNIEQCMQTYEQYEAYIQNHFGKESNVKYSKLICQVFLLVEADEPEEALVKCNESIELHLKKYGNEPIQPLLYKLSILVKIAVVSLEGQKCEGESKQFLTSTLEMIDSKPVLSNCSIAHYYTAIIFIFMKQYERAKECLQLAVSLSDQCTFNIFYSKAVLLLKMGYYMSAYKDISSSIAIMKTSDAYLVKCLILLKFSDQKQPLKQEVINLIKRDNKQEAQIQMKSINLKFVREYIIEKCLDQLKNYIYACYEDEDQIPIWVTKILFACRSFDEALLSFDKVRLQYHEEIFMIAQCLSIYSGDFEKGGKVGLIIKQSFDGTFLTTEEQEQILKSSPIKDYSSPKFDYLDYNYQKWLIILQLYRKQQYLLCIEYIKTMIKSLQEDEEQTQFLLTYNLAILYFIVNDRSHAIEAVQSLFKFNATFNTKSSIQKILECRFVPDECLSDLTSQLFFRSSKLLSNYLSYKQIYLTKNGQQVKVYARISVPFPSFYKPKLQIDFSTTYILSELNLSKIPKRIEAPWIKRVKNSIQFTQQLTNTITSLESKTNEGNSNCTPFSPKQSGLSSL